jgi:hypothetical protein
MAIIGAISSSHPGTIEYTGSFAKILCVSASGTSVNNEVHSVKFDKIVFGKTINGGIATATNVVSQSDVPVGTYIEGPIQSFRLATDGGHVFAYYHEI